MRFENESSFLPALRIYYYLPLYIKRCFVYCSLFPKDYEFERDELVLLWMAESLLQQPKSDSTLEEVGYKYFTYLASRSFFQHFNSDESSFLEPLNSKMQPSMMLILCCHSLVATKDLLPSTITPVHLFRIHSVSGIKNNKQSNVLSSMEAFLLLKITLSTDNMYSLTKIYKRITLITYNMMIKNIILKFDVALVSFIERVTMLIITFIKIRRQGQNEIRKNFMDLTTTIESCLRSKLIYTTCKTIFGTSLFMNLLLCFIKDLCLIIIGKYLSVIFDGFGLNLVLCTTFYCFTVFYRKHNYQHYMYFFFNFLEAASFIFGLVARMVLALSLTVVLQKVANFCYNQISILVDMRYVLHAANIQPILGLSIENQELKLSKKRGKNINYNRHNVI
ncbi:hypothetical protein Ahy_A02g005162 isoform A [Arachis hypogaea]|uniref:Disease resistance protein winged helix domain-containing protein n=1 Tax=Arachis hypogaea TaxID=3818 RepID=A0A445E5Y4_ARAHY|nr:hypothetical protein Ahy_A02g005162 isoform A [Arachis hypogaea]